MLTLGDMLQIGPAEDAAKKWRAYLVFSWGLPAVGVLICVLHPLITLTPKLLYRDALPFGLDPDWSHR